MIERYSLPEMSQIWGDRHRYLVWLRVEFAVCEELAAMGLIPEGDWKELEAACRDLMDRGGVDPAAVEACEKVTRHDVIAFTTAVADELGPISRYVHFGLTSSDVVDTSLSILLQEAGEILLLKVEKLMAALKKQADTYRDLPTIGRSHGIFAEPTSFGLKFAGWYSEWKRNQRRLKLALENCAFGKLSGAVGVNAHWDVDTEVKILGRLMLRREPLATQVVPRDRHAELLNAIGICGSSIERISVELRHLQRSEVREVMEGFSKGQKGSSAMPHKRNPISSENLSGCARLLRAYCQTGLENIALWHERDISHSSVERISFPDGMILLDYALNRMTGVIENLVVDRERVQENLEAAGRASFSGHYLLALVQAGATREDAYAWVQACALASLDGQGDFVDLLIEHKEIGSLLDEKTIRELGSMGHQLRHVDGIYDAVFGNAAN